MTIPASHRWLFGGYPFALGWACTYTTDEAGRPILLKSRDKGWQLLAGGMIDPGETPWEAAVRETEEETGRILTGEPRFLASVFRPPTERLPTRFGFVFDGGVMTAEQIAAIVLDPAEHTDHAVRSLDEWQPLVPVGQFELIGRLGEARRSGVPFHLAGPDEAFA
ncbi:NUDIX domain-containing protein [Kitasatospora sp. NPDC094015]|uniref:NUDIX domain-containing protein n=1 Tax=Kitasatospora sp. NPDC094015 TaxID=3155205 RepID=UPI00331D31D5